MGNNRRAYKALDTYKIEGNRGRGRPRNRSMDNFTEHHELKNLTKIL